MKITESQFANTIEQTLTMFGWWWFHSRPLMRQDGTWRTAYSGCDGAPDYPLVLRGNRALMIELKADDGKLLPEQYFAMCQGVEAGLEVYLWQPKDDYQKIIEILR